MARARPENPGRATVAASTVAVGKSGTAVTLREIAGRIAGRLGVAPRPKQPPPIARHKWQGPSGAPGHAGRGPSRPVFGSSASSARPRGISRNFVLLLGLWLLSGAALVVSPAALGVLTFVFVVLGWLVGLVVHEFGHAWIAWRAGDHTVATRGYLTMDPLKYADPATSVVIPVIVLAIGGFALPGGAVYLRPDLMRSARWRAASSLAGPAGTLLVLIVLAIALAIGTAMGWSGALWPAIAVLAMFQAMALVFNLLPVPGLDGYGVIRPFLPPAVRRRLLPAEKFAIFILIGALFFIPGVSSLLFGSAFGVASLLGVDRTLVVEGLGAFRFWR